jgi:hypothetical protein
MYFAYNALTISMAGIAVRFHKFAHTDSGFGGPGLGHKRFTGVWKFFVGEKIQPPYSINIGVL